MPPDADPMTAPATGQGGAAGRLNIRLEGTFTLRSPLSHIGESISTATYLVEETVLQPGGGAERVFAYSGNAWRGQLRDLMAGYMLDHLPNVHLTIDSFHLLFSGGRIGGAQSIDLDKARRMRSAVPMLALLGGGMGNQILQGKLRVGTSYPLCREAVPALPRALKVEAETVAYADCTMRKSYSRRDDAKVEDLARYLLAATAALPPPEGEAKKPRSRKEETGTADQMRMESELVAPGVRLWSWIAGQNLTEIELGCLVSGLHRFSLCPQIGGQGARGHGLVDLSYALRDMRTGQVQEFLTVEDGACLLAPCAAEAKAAYDRHLRSLYDDALEARGGEIACLLGAAAA